MSILEFGMRAYRSRVHLSEVVRSPNDYYSGECMKNCFLTQMPTRAARPCAGDIVSKYTFLYHSASPRNAVSGACQYEGVERGRLLASGSVSQVSS